MKRAASGWGCKMDRFDTVLTAVRDLPGHWTHYFHHGTDTTYFNPPNGDKGIRLKPTEFLALGEVLGWKPSPAGVDRRGVSRFFDVDLS